MPLATNVRSLPVLMGKLFRSSAGARGAAAAVVATVLSYFPAPALAQTADIPEGQTAQTTRAEEDRASREAKATQLVPERRSKIEAVLYKIDEDLILQRIFNPPRGIHARVGGIGEGGGFGGGAGYQFIGVPFDFRTSAAASLKGYFIAEGSLRFPGTQSEDALHLGERALRGGVRAVARLSPGGLLRARARQPRGRPIELRAAGYVRARHTSRAAGLSDRRREPGIPRSVDRQRHGQEHAVD